MFGLCKISAQMIVSFGSEISKLIWCKHERTFLHTRVHGKHTFYFNNAEFSAIILFFLMKKRRFHFYQSPSMRGNLTILVAAVIDDSESSRMFYDIFDDVRNNTGIHRELRARLKNGMQD